WPPNLPVFTLQVYTPLFPPEFHFLRPEPNQQVTAGSNPLAGPSPLSLGVQSGLIQARTLSVFHSDRHSSQAWTPSILVKKIPHPSHFSEIIEGNSDKTLSIPSNESLLSILTPSFRVAEPHFF